ncbi:hypothetical protein FHU35_11220 [Saccharopolyspora dendranthemae]|uniref:Uncharacterized protein n=1 Tax=Saccharopolyspora dendranthemae TaxID=1181886 RepID=A0A561V7N7_9PSEU|nr:hypothetical protein FHU35_11220 [Saccharopolyspora dendranthemae]
MWSGFGEQFGECGTLVEGGLGAKVRIGRGQEIEGHVDDGDVLAGAACGSGLERGELEVFVA